MATDRFNGVVASKAIKVRCVVAAEANVASLNGQQTIEGIPVVQGDRVLLTAQTDPILNGIWDVVNGADWTRAADWDGNRDIEYGTVVYAGQLGGEDKLWQVQTAGVIVIGSTAVTVTEIFNPNAPSSASLADVTSIGDDTLGNNITISGDVPILTIQDTNNTGATATGEISFIDSGSTELASIQLNSSDLQLDSVNGSIRVTASNGFLQVDSPVKVIEQAAQSTPEAGYGQYWVRDDQVPMFTDGLGNDYELNAAGGGSQLADSFTYNNTVSGATDPGAETFRMSTINPASVSWITFNDTALSGVDIGTVFDRLQVGSWFFMRNDDRSTVHRMRITGITDNAGWWELDVDQAEGDGTAFTDGEEVFFEFHSDAYTQSGTVSGSAHSLLYWDDSIFEWRETFPNLIGINPVSPPGGGRLQFGSPSTSVRTSPNINHDFLTSGQGAVWRVEDGASATDNFGSFAAFNVSPAYLTYEIDDFEYMRLQSDGRVYFQDWQTQGGSTTQGFFWQEKGAAGTAEAGYGEFWVRSDTPNTPMFTDDAGTDFNLLDPTITPTFNTPLRIIGDTDGAPPASQTALLEFYDSDESDRQAFIGYNASNDFVIETAFANNGQDFSIFHGIDRILHNEGTGGRTYLEAGTGVTGDIYIRPNAGNDDGIRVMYQGAVELYNNNALVANTNTAAAGGFTVNNQLTGGGNERVLTNSDRSRGWPSSIWQFDSSTTSSDPGNGNFRLNNATTSLATEMYIDDNNEYIQGSDRLIEYLSAGDVISFHRVDANNLHTWFRVTGAPTDNTGWWTVPIEYLYGTAFASTELYTLFPFHLSAVEGTLPAGTVDHATLYNDNGTWSESDRIRNAEDGSLNIYATDDLSSNDSRIEWWTNSGTTRGWLGPATQNSDFTVTNMNPGTEIALRARNGADSATRNILRGDPDAQTAIYGQTDIQFLVASTKRMGAIALASGGMGMAQSYNGANDADNERILTDSQHIWMGPTTKYRYEATTTASDPGPGDLRFDSTTPASITNIYANDNDHYEIADQGWLWNSLSDGDLIVIRSDVDANDYWIGSVNGTPTDNTGWWTIPVTHIRSGTIFTTDDLLNISVQYMSEAAAPSGTITGTLTNNQVAIASGADTIDGDANFTYDGSTVAIGNSAVLDLGSTTGDRINVFGSSYTIGIESNTMYFNTNSDFDWYEGGAGGTPQMTLNSSARLSGLAGGIQCSGGNIQLLGGGNIGSDTGSIYSGTDDNDGVWLEGGVSDYGMYLSSSGNAQGGRPTGDTNSDLNLFFTVNNGTNRGFVFKTNGKTNVAADMTFAINPQHGILSQMPLKMVERATPLVATATMGQFWVRNDTPNTPMFTDDAGNDFELAVGAGFTTTWTTGGGTTFNTGATSLYNAGAILEFQEQASLAAPAAGFGRLWVRNDTPNALIFTDDAGTDHDLTAGGGGGNVSNTGTPLNNQIAIWTDATTIEGVAAVTYNGSSFTVNNDITIGGTGSLIMADDREIRWGGGSTDLLMDFDGTASQLVLNFGTLGQGMDIQDEGVSKVEFDTVNARVEFKDDWRILMEETANAPPGAIAAFAQLWVDDTTTPGNRFAMTMDDGEEIYLGSAGIQWRSQSSRPYGAPGANNGLLWMRDFNVTEPAWSDSADSTRFMMNTWTDLRYEFDTSTVSADPGSGELRLDNATPASVTALYISDGDQGSVGHGAKWSDLIRGDIIEIGAVTNPDGRFIRLRVNGDITDNTTWVSVPVEVIDSGTIFNSAEVLSVEVHKTPKVLQDYEIQSESYTPTGTTQTLNYEDGPAFEIDLESVTGNATVTLSGGPTSGNYGQITVKVTQDSATARTITWAGGTFEWAGGAAHVVTTTLNGFSIFTFETWDGGTTWFAAGADYS